MESLFFMVVSFVMANPADLDRPLFVYYKPNFETHAECHHYANKNHRAIYIKAVQKMGKDHVPESIYCITGAQVKQMHNYTYQSEEKKNI